MFSKGYTSRAGSHRGRAARIYAGAAVLALLATVFVSGAGGANAVPAATNPSFVTLPTPGSPVAVASSPDGTYLLLANSCSTVYSLSGASFVPFATLPSATKCPTQSIAVSPGLGNFAAGTVYVSQGSTLFAVPANNSGSAVSQPWTLSAPISGAITGLAFDAYGAFANTLLVTAGSSGAVYAVNASGGVTSLGAFGTMVGGPAVAPSGFGAIGGQLVATAKSGGAILAFNVSSAVTSFASYKSAEAVAFVPPLSCSFENLTLFVTEPSGNALLGFPAADFASWGGYGLVVGGSRGAGIGLLSSSGTTSAFFSSRATLEGAAYVACPIGISKRIHLPSTIFPNLIGFDPVSNQLVGADQNSTNLLFLDGTTGAQVASVPGGISPYALALNPKKNVLYVTNTGSNNVTELNASTDTVLGSLAGLAAPTGIAYDSANQKLYVASSGTGTVQVFSQVGNPYNNGNLSVGGELLGLVYDPVDTNIYVAVAQGAVVVISPNFNTLTTIPLGTAVDRLAVNTTTGTVFATEPNANQVVAIFNGSVVATVPVGVQPLGIAFDAQNGLVFVANNGSGTLSVIDGYAVIDTLAVGTDLGPLVYDPISGLVYGTADVTNLGIDPRIILGASS